MTSKIARLLTLSLLASPAYGCADDAGSADETDGSTGGNTTAPTTTGATDPTSASGVTTETPTTDATDPTSSSSGDPSSSSGDDETEGDTETTGETEKPELGQTPNVLCEATVAAFTIIVDENASVGPDPMVIEEAYLGLDGSGGVLQDFVQTYGGLLGRVEDGVLIDDAFILNALTDGSPEALVDVETRLYTLTTKLYRYRVSQVADALPDVNRPPALLYAQWDDAYCYFDGILRPQAAAVDLLGIDFTDGGVRNSEEDIQYGFEWGHDNIEGPDASWAIDEWAVPSAKQIVEKTVFRIYDRLVLDTATLARDGTDPLLARRALGYFGALEDRFEDRNTPGIAVVRAELELDDPSLMDIPEIQRQLDITWIKRTRRYTDAPIVDKSIGTPGGYKSANEGRTYAKIALPRMADALDGFDAAAHLAEWDAMAAAVEADDAAAVTAAATTLTDDNCAYHTALGLADCTSADVE